MTVQNSTSACHLNTVCFNHSDVTNHIVETIDDNCALVSFTWTGGNNDNLWFSPDNWDQNLVPDGDDVVYIGLNGQANVIISGAVAAADNIVLSSGSSLRIDAGASLMHTSNTLSIANGTLKGTGDFIGDIFVDYGGHIVAGDPYTSTNGTLTINGNVTVQNDGGFLEIQINGTASGQYSVLNVTGSCDLFNSLYLYYGSYNGNYYTPDQFDEIVFITSGSLGSGTFNFISPFGWNVTLNDPTSGMAKVTYDPPPPSNDECIDAQLVTVPGFYSGYTIDANPSLDAYPSCNSIGDYDIWYSFVAPASGKIQINNFPFEVHALALWSNVCGSLIEEACQQYDDFGQTCNQILKFDLVPTQTYYIQLISENQESNLFFNMFEPNSGPTNEFCTTAIVASIGNEGDCPTGEINGTSVNAHHLYDVNCSFDYQCDILNTWYDITTPTSGRVRFIPSNPNLSAVVFSGSCGSLVQEACLTAEGSVILSGSTNYKLMISTHNNYMGNAFAFCLEEAPEPPANDNCSGAISVSVSPNGSCSNVSGSTITATTSLQNPCAFDGNELYLLDLWYSFEAPADGRVTFHSLLGNPLVVFYSGTCGSLVALDNGCTKGTGTIAGLTSGTIYYMQVMTPPGPGVDFEFCLEVSSPAPVNNLCSNSLPLTLGSTLTLPSTIYAKSIPGLPSCAPPSLNTPSLWYSFEAVSTEIFYSNNLDVLALTLYTGCGGVIDEVPFACAVPYNDLPPIAVTPGQTYYAQITSLPPQSSGYEFLIESIGDPDIEVEGKYQIILDGDITPDTNDDTDFGNQFLCNGSRVVTFTIHNYCNNQLTVSAINVTGTNVVNFTIGGITLPTIVPLQDSVTFTVTFDPSGLDVHTATIEILSDDPDESNYDFAISGYGVEVYHPEDNIYYCSLQAAIDAGTTEDGDEIHIPSGDYSGTCVTINKSVVITAIGGNVCHDCIEINGSGNMLDLGSNFTFNTLMLTNGKINLNGYNLRCGSIIGGNTGSYIITD